MPREQTHYIHYDKYPPMEAAMLVALKISLGSAPRAADEADVLSTKNDIFTHEYRETDRGM